MDILGDDFQTRFCTQPLAWFNSGYSSCVNATVTLQCRSSSTVGVKRSCHAELLGFGQSGDQCPPPRGEEYEKMDSSRLQLRLVQHRIQFMHQFSVALRHLQDSEHRILRSVFSLLASLENYKKLYFHRE